MKLLQLKLSKNGALSIQTNLEELDSNILKSQTDFLNIELNGNNLTT